MTSPFNKKPDANKTPAQALAPAGERRLAGANTVQDQLEMLPAGVTVKVKVDAFRYTPPNAAQKMGVCFYVDFTILEVESGSGVNLVPGKKWSHRVNGFEGTSAAKSFRQLWNLELALLASDGLTEESTEEDGTPINRETLPFRIVDEALAVGKVIWISTESTRPGRDGGYTKVIGSYAAAE